MYTCQQEVMSMYPSIKTPTRKMMILSLALIAIVLSGSIQAGDEGCVTCHVGPMALNELLAKNEAHPDVSAMVNTIPTDCAMCHQKGTEMALMGIVHAKHEGVDCTSCHVVDENNMPTSNKTGAKNW
jgi:nitrate/TMAO reductase-like tetraheme cytochrome c subunit